MGGRGASTGGGGPSPATYKDMTAKEEKAFTEETAKEYEETLTEAQLQSLAEYQGGAYSPINKGLRYGEKLDKDDKKDIRNIDKAMQNHKTEENMVVYRGLNPKEVEAIDAANIGDKFKDKGYMSTSISKDVARSFARTTGEASQGRPKYYIAKYNLPKGSKALYMPGVNKSQGRETIKDKEKELVLGRGQTATYKGISARGRQVIVEFDVK